MAKSDITTITVSKKTQKKLGLIKINHDYKTYDSLLLDLVKISKL